MDRRQARARVLTAVALLLCCAADRPRLPIRDARWLASNDLVRDLTRDPPECLRLPRSASERRSVAIGRAAFRSPLLLGGQAARAGLSCASCHRNGRSNPHFRFPGISGPPGTADVTASLMSKKRGDGTFNPKPIPDLAGSKLKLSRDPRDPELRRFIHGLIVEEFDGPEPPAPVLDGITAYVRAMSPAACPKQASVPITLDVMLADVDAAVRAAERAYRNGDQATGGAMVAAARATLGALNERFRLPELERSRALLAEAAIELGRIQRAGTVTSAMFAEWRKAWPRRTAQLRRSADRSLFSPAVLRRELARS